jgi:hypothetical protein
MSNIEKRKGEWPRLSEVAGPRCPDKCQNCGSSGGDDGWLEFWEECDRNDKPEGILVVLCRACAARLIKPHPRLYERKEIPSGEPWPGAMPVCVTCAYRSGLDCKHPLLKRNGGAGLPLKFPQPGRGVACTRGKGCRPFFIFQGPVRCESRREMPVGNPPV